MTPELEDLFSFLRFPSVSTDSRHVEDIRACADWLIAKLSGMGLTTELHETPKHPVVIARNAHVPGRRTVLIYGHYDVQPVDPLNLWTSDPFQPEIREGKNLGPRCHRQQGPDDGPRARRGENAARKQRAAGQSDLPV